MTFSNLNLDKYSDQAINDLVTSNENPVLISFLSPIVKNLVITIPVWTYAFKDKFYIFTGKNSLKVKAIKKGLNYFSLIIVDKNSFPDVYSSDMPYLSISGVAKIVSCSQNTDIPSIHLKILEKYNFDGAPDWISNLISKIQLNPEDTWLIEITPSKAFTFNE